MQPQMGLMTLHLVTFHYIDILFNLWAWFVGRGTEWDSYDLFWKYYPNIPRL